MRARETQRPWRGDQRREISERRTRAANELFEARVRDVRRADAREGGEPLLAAAAVNDRASDTDCDPQATVLTEVGVRADAARERSGRSVLTQCPDTRAVQLAKRAE
jgi:hypothetical protein